MSLRGGIPRGRAVHVQQSVREIAERDAAPRIDLIDVDCSLSASAMHGACRGSF